MQRGLFFSLVLHLTVVVLAWVGLPNLADRKLVDDSPIVVEMVDVADKTNVPAPTPQPKKQPKKVETPPEPPKAKEPDVPKPPEPKSPPPAPTPPPEPKPAPPPKPEAKAEPAPAPEPKPEKKAAPVPKPDKKVPEKTAEKKSEPAPPPKPAPRLVTTTPPKKPKAPKAPEEFQVTSVLKTLEQIKKQQPQDSKDKPKDKKPTKKAETPPPDKKPADDFAQRMREALANKQSKNFDPSAKVTQSEIDAVKRQLRRCWNPPPGGKNAEDMVISIELQMNPDGTVQRADIADKARMASDPFFRASAEAGLRAVLNPRCNPLKLPPDKYQQWQQITLNFNPKEMY